jgi:hypothetical protein
MATQRKRSPNFPYASVKDCIEYLTKLQNQVKTNKVPIFLAFGHMGLNPKSSTSDRIRASMASYGLTIEETVNKEKFVRVSDLANRIIVDTRQNHRLSALREAALNDPMVKKMWDGEWKRGLPNDDATIISVLQVEYEFQEEAAKRFTNVLKENYQYCELASYYEVPQDAESYETTYSTGENPLPGNNIYEQEDTNLVQYPIPLDNGRLAYISLPSFLSENDAEYIPDFVNLLLKKLRRASKDEAEQKEKE